MSEQGYIVPVPLLRLAIEKATPDEAEQLSACEQLVSDVDTLERSVPMRLEDARARVGIEMPRLPKAAKEAVAQSAAAGQEIDRLLIRKCNRATSAAEIVRELLAVAKGDLQSAAFFAREAPDEPSQEILDELYEQKREVVERLRAFLAANP